MASRGKLTAKDCNFVHVDDSWFVDIIIGPTIWRKRSWYVYIRIALSLSSHRKTYVWKEEVASKRWQDNWGFLCEEYHKVYNYMHQM